MCDTELALDKCWFLLLRRVWPLPLLYYNFMMSLSPLPLPQLDLGLWTSVSITTS